VRSVAKGCEKEAEDATQDDAKQREVSALSPGDDAVEAALADTLARAAEAGRFDVVAQLAKELEARRWRGRETWCSSAANVPSASPGAANTQR
jgi:hypothetical protein